MHLTVWCVFPFWGYVTLYLVALVAASGHCTACKAAWPCTESSGSVWLPSAEMHPAPTESGCKLKCLL